MNGRYSRVDAGLKPPRFDTLSMHPPLGVIVHHTAGRRPSSPDEGPEIWRRVQAYHRNPKPAGKGWSDIGYSWGFDDFGQIYEGRGWGVSGAHTRGRNRTYHGLVYLGHGDEVAEPALDALGALICEHDELYCPGLVLAHRDVSSTLCPGKKLYDHLRAAYAERRGDAGA